MEISISIQGLFLWEDECDFFQCTFAEVTIGSRVLFSETHCVFIRFRHILLIFCFRFWRTKIFITARAFAVGLQVFDGNVDSYQVKHAYLDEPIIGRYVKFHMVSWHRHPSMRVEIIGCQGQSILPTLPVFTGAGPPCR